MSLRTIKRIKVAPGIEVRVRRDSDWKEYRIESVYDGKVRESQTGYTDDREDALNTSDEVAAWHRRQPGYGRSNPRRKARSNPSAQIPKSEIEFIVRKMHVGTTDAEVKAEMDRRLRDAPTAWTPALKRQAIAYAIKAHHKNQKLYDFAMGSRLRSNPKKRKAPARRKATARRKTRR